jgi:hypothetical protein
VGPDLFISSYALNQVTNKDGSTVPELSFRNYHVWSQTFAVNNILFISISLVNPLNNLCVLHEVERTPPVETTSAHLSVYLLSSYTSESRDVTFATRWRLISYKSSQLVNSQGLTGITFQCLLQTVKDIRLGRT